METRQPVASGAFSPDGRTLALLTQSASLTAPKTYSVELWDPARATRLSAEDLVQLDCVPSSLLAPSLAFRATAPALPASWSAGWAAARSSGPSTRTHGGARRAPWSRATSRPPSGSATSGASRTTSRPARAPECGGFPSACGHLRNGGGEGGARFPRWVRRFSFPFRNGKRLTLRRRRHREVGGAFFLAISPRKAPHPRRWGLRARLRMFERLVRPREARARVGCEQHREAVARVARRAALLAQDERRPRPARVELGRELGGDLARHPADLRAARGVYRDRVRVVLVAGCRRSSRGLPGFTASEAIASAWWRPAPATPTTRSPCAASSGASRAR